MTREAFDQLVRHIEARYGGSPRRLRRVVTLWAALGFGWFAAWIVLAALFAAGVLMLNLLVFWGTQVLLWLLFVSFIAAAGRAFRPVFRGSTPEPKGRKLTQADAPELFARLATLRQKLGARAIHEVYLTPELNAGIVQQPRLGLLGWWRNRLLIGLPLLEILPEEEVQTVLAHELAHHSHRHGQVTHRLYRLRQSWEQLFATFQEQTVEGEISFRTLSAWFGRHFWPRFNARAFVLSRTHEYEADALAARLTNAATVASALQRFSIANACFGKTFWPDIQRLAEQQPEPPADLVERMLARYRDLLTEPERAEAFLRSEWLQVSTNDDTHPCLRERVEALGQSAALPAPATQSAAESLLGPRAGALREEMNALWQDLLREQWAQWHQKSGFLRCELARLRQAAPAANAENLWDEASLNTDLGEKAEAERHLRRLLEQEPAHAGALFSLGQLLVERAEPEGVALLEAAMREDEGCVPPACQHLIRYHIEAGNADAVRQTELRLDQHDHRTRTGWSDLSALSPRDPLAPHGLSREELAPLRKALARHPEIRTARLVRKHFPYPVRQPVFLLCLQVRRWWWRRVEKEQALLNALLLPPLLPGRVRIFLPRRTLRRLARKIGAEAEVYNVRRR